MTFLYKRRIRLAEVVRNNRWLAIFLIYCLVSILWSDFPFVATKRWLKVLGHPVMALIILTEVDPTQALTKFMKRVAFVLIPFSVLFVKYYPQYGRGYDEWTGRVIFTGITRDKNALGYLCMSSGFFWIWHFLRTRTAKRSFRRRNELLLCVAFLSMTLWLLTIVDAKTALVTFLVSSVTAVLLGTRWVVKKYIGVYVLAAIITALVADLAFGAFSEAIGALGRDPTLTDRSQVWNDVLAIDNDPVLGTGFESFWLGERLDKLWAKWWWHPNQAHNGYIETYLNLGMLGVVILAGLILSTFRKIRRELLTNLDLGRFRFSLFIAILIFNYTDAIFKALHPLWFLFYIIAMDYPQSRPKSRENLAEFDDREHEPRSFPVLYPV